MTPGSATVTDDWPACSVGWLMIVRTGGRARAAVSPFAPTAPEMCGVKGSAPQSVGVKLLVLVTGVAGSPSGVASTEEIASLHDVGLRMNGPVPPAGLPCSVNAIRSVKRSRPPDCFGSSATIESSPPSLARAWILVGTYSLPSSPPSGRSTAPSRAGSAPSGSRL